jgi:hypothetical protein
MCGTLGWRGISSCTSPRTERALTSAEVELGNGRFNVAAVAGQAVFAAIAKVANVVDRAAGGNHLHQRSRNRGSG